MGLLTISLFRTVPEHYFWAHKSFGIAKSSHLGSLNVIKRLGLPILFLDCAGTLLLGWLHRHLNRQNICIAWDPTILTEYFFL